MGDESVCNECVCIFFVTVCTYIAMRLMYEYNKRYKCGLQMTNRITNIVYHLQNYM